jgi:rhodanese-related sulfurtransferase
MLYVGETKMSESVQVAELKEALEKGDCQLLDVREYAEFATAHIRGARLIPLRELRGRVVELDRNRPLYVICRTGRRARQAREILRACGFGDVRLVEGGMLAWQERGFAIESEARAPWSLERQVRFAAGALVLVGALASLLIARPFIWLAIFVGAGLVFAAVTDTCGMALLLARMPWNRARENPSCRGLERSGDE